MANPTTYFGWVMPTSTDLVTDLPADFNVFGQGVDTSMQDLLGGTTGQVLSKTSATNMDFTWVTPTDQTPLTTKGDLFTFTTVDARIGVGANDTVLTADSAQATGLKWAAPSSSSGPAFSAFRTSSDQSITTTTSTKVQLNGETFDTDNCFDSTTNYRFTPTKAGYYQLNATITAAGATISRAILNFYKNGSEYVRFSDYSLSVNQQNSGSTLVYFNGTTDYAELYVFLIGTTLLVNQGSAFTTFSGVWIRS